MKATRLTEPHGLVLYRLLLFSDVIRQFLQSIAIIMTAASAKQNARRLRQQEVVLNGEGLSCELANCRRNRISNCATKRLNYL